MQITGWLVDLSSLTKKTLTTHLEVVKDEVAVLGQVLCVCVVARPPGPAGGLACQVQAVCGVAEA